MRRTWLVIKFEFLSIVLSPTFIILLLLAPLIPLLMYFVMTLSLPHNTANQSETQSIQKILDPKSTAIAEVIGLVDESGIVRDVPSRLRNQLRIFTNRFEAQSALELDEVSVVYILPVDYLEEGNVIVFLQNPEATVGFMERMTLSEVLYYNLLDNNAILTERFTLPLQHKRIMYLSIKPRFDFEDPSSVLVFFALYFFLFLAIYGSASLMLNGLTKEKQNRIIEVLLTSITPRQLMIGKIVALGLVGLLQVIVWLGIAMAFRNLNIGVFGFLGKLELSASMMIWVVLLFIPTYVLYSSLLAGIGAITTSVRAINQMLILVMLPLMAPMTLLPFMLREPDGVLSVLVSLFPLTSAIGMLMRMLLTDVPLWQTLLALMLTWGTAFAIMRLVAGMFRAQYLLSNQPFRWWMLISALQGRA